MAEKIRRFKMNLIYRFFYCSGNHQQEAANMKGLPLSMSVCVCVWGGYEKVQSSCWVCVMSNLELNRLSFVSGS